MIAQWHMLGDPSNATLKELFTKWRSLLAQDTTLPTTQIPDPDRLVDHAIYTCCMLTPLKLIQRAEFCEVNVGAGKSMSIHMLALTIMQTHAQTHYIQSYTAYMHTTIIIHLLTCHSMDLYDRLVWELWMPKFRSIIR